MKEAITEAQFRKQIKNPEPLYLFFGDEDYLKQNAIAVARENIVAPGSEAFDLVRIDRASFSADSVSQ